LVRNASAVSAETTALRPALLSIPVALEEPECLKNKAPWKVWKISAAEFPYPPVYPYICPSIAHG